MAAEPRHRSRKHQIEPLSWAEAAQSPALKGMLSFLDVSAADVRNSQNQDPDLYSSSGNESLPVSESLRIVTIPSGIPAASAREEGATLIPVRISKTISESLPGSVSPPASETLAISEPRPRSESLPISKSLPVSDSLTGSKSGMVVGTVSSQNRKIRKCRLVQDAHSSGEELLYRILWDEAKPDPMNPVGSRTLRMGYAELAAKARMHKTNVRLNLSNLKAKLAIDVLEEHNSSDLIPRLYRIFSFREILDRRKTAGLEYVIRQKNVVFVEPDGTPIPLQNTLTGKTKRKLASRWKRTSDNDSDSLTGSDSLIGSDSDRENFQYRMEQSSVDNPDSKPEQLNLDVRKVSESLNKYWTTDEAAAHQLVRDCRRVRSDAQGDEIAFFVEEKLAIAKLNRNITNPTGLIIATVPQCFVGSAFEEFRRRRNEQLRIAAEEDIRKRLQESEMEAWMSREVERLEEILRDTDASDQEKTNAHRRLLNFK